MKLPAEIANLVVSATAQVLADRMNPQIEDLQLVTIGKAAEMLSVSEPKARRLIREYIDLGEASKRVRVSTLKRIIAERTIQA